MRHLIDDYAKDGGPGEVQLLCSFYHEPLPTWIETSISKFAISNHMALKIDLNTLGNCLMLICEYELYILPNKKGGVAKHHGKNYMRDRPPLVRHLLRNDLLRAMLIRGFTVLFKNVCLLDLTRTIFLRTNSNQY